MAYSLKKEIILHAPIQKVWTTYRDHLPTLAEVMPTVESITVINRKETIKEVYLENIWKLSAGIPFAIRKIIPEKLLSYRDQATWKEELWVCDFIETPVDGSNIYICKGRNTFLELCDKTLLEISFELSIDPYNIPGIPYLIAKSLVKKIEPIISKEVAKNLEKTAKQVENFIQKKNS